MRFLMTAIPTIEELWQSLAAEGHPTLFRRVDESHPLELYAELEQPDRPGLVLFCHQKPPETRSLRALRIDQGYRPDGRWWLRLSLSASVLEPVFYRSLPRHYRFHPKRRCRGGGGSSNPLPCRTLAPASR